MQESKAVGVFEVLPPVSAVSRTRCTNLDQAVNHRSFQILGER